jgi:hypothetical protein
MQRNTVRHKPSPSPSAIANQRTVGAKSIEEQTHISRAESTSKGKKRWKTKNTGKKRDGTKEKKRYMPRTPVDCGTLGRHWTSGWLDAGRTGDRYRPTKKTEEGLREF